jgi:ATP-dependent DNA helicase PIF1
MESRLDKIPTMPPYTKSYIIDYPPSGNGDQKQPHHKPTIEGYTTGNNAYGAATTRATTNFRQHRCRNQQFIDGPGGTGKTILYSTLIEHKRGQQKPAVVVASSGIVSIVLQQEQTVHSAFNIPISITNKTTCFFTRRSILGQAAINATVIFWDGSPMLHENVYEAMDKMFRKEAIEKMINPFRYLMDLSNIPFDGKVVVFGGDFLQTLPIIAHGTESDIVNASIKRSPTIWGPCHCTQTYKKT